VSFFVLVNIHAPRSGKLQCPRSHLSQQRILSSSNVVLAIPQKAWTNEIVGFCSATYSTDNIIVVLVRHVAFASEYDVEVRVGKVKGRGCTAGVMDETTSDRLGDDTGRRGSRRCMTSLQA
jgi:hypothetical protein